MPGEKRFRTSFMGGFKKSDVNAYIENILNEFDEKLKSKDDEISALKNQNRELRMKYEELLQKANEVSDARAKIADVLIQAQEKADKMLENARLESLEERKMLEQSVEKEREKLVDIRTDLRNLKSEIVRVLSKYAEEISELARVDEDEADPPADNAAEAAEEAAAEAMAEAAAANDYNNT